MSFSPTCQFCLRNSTISKNDNQPQVEISESCEDGMNVVERNWLMVIRNNFKSHQKKILGKLHLKKWFENVSDYDSYALKLNPKVIFITSALLIASIVIINNRLQSRQLKPQLKAKKKSILAISNVFWSNDSELQNRERPVLIDYNGK